jgi:hypothetical protein
MLVRIAVALSAVAFAVPALAEPLSAEAARRFVAGKQFSFTCFEGTVGSGRIFGDGSVAGMLRIQGSGPVRFMRMPAGTLFAKGETVCSHVKGAFFNPCFNLNKTSERSFRGAVSGFGFAYCDFTHGRGREMIASVGPSPDDKLPMPRSIRRATRSHAHPSVATTSSIPAAATAAPSAPVAAPTTPVTAAPLPSMEQTGMRGSVSQ